MGWLGRGGDLPSAEARVSLRGSWGRGEPKGGWPSRATTTAVWGTR